MRNTDENNIFEFEGLQAESLKEANISKNTIIQIYRDYILNQEILKQQAQYFGNILHLGEEINSVKWRVKDPIHLLTKIVRKRKKAINEHQKSPYLEINVTNYKNIIDDLVGIRAIYLFKENWGQVNKFILENFSVCGDENITIYHAPDDDLSFYPNDNLSDYKYKRVERDSRYRSTHYIIKGITPHSYNFELQTRTILDEAWGEIDHHVRYPKFEHHPELKRKMSVLNGAISGCEELTSSFYSYFNSLDSNTTDGDKALDFVNTLTVHPEQEQMIQNIPDNMDIVEETAKITDEVWDSIISKAAQSRENERVLKNKGLLDTDNKLSSSHNNVLDELIKYYGRMLIPEDSHSSLSSFFNNRTPDKGEKIPNKGEQIIKSLNESKVKSEYLKKINVVSKDIDSTNDDSDDDKN